MSFVRQPASPPLRLHGLHLANRSVPFTKVSMRRLLVVLFTLSGVFSASLEAQTCHGLAPLPAGQLQATGTAMLSAGTRSVSAALAYDLPAGAFGGVGIGRTEVEAFEKSSVDLSASLAYQLELGGSGRAQVCPVASTSLQLGPNNAFGSGVARSTFSAGIGFSGGAEFRLRPLLSLVPALAVGVGHRTHQAESRAGATLFRIAETYGLAQLHVGMVVNQNLSIRPSVEIPLGLDSGDAVLGLTVGYRFGHGQSSGAGR
jgi:hypothetical protein